MLGIPTGRPPAVTPDGKVIPAERHGVKTMSMGMFTGEDTPAVLRGPMVGKYLRMLIGGVQWGDLDYLILDLPPGTGDTQLTLAQSLTMSGTVIVTTPQDVSLKIARRGLRMFEKVHVPILGIVENMSTFTCPHCGKSTDIFRRGGGERMSRQLGVPFLGAIPLDADIVTSGDEGRPIVIDKPKSVAAQAYAAIAAALAEQLGAAPSIVLKSFAWRWDSNEGAPSWREGVVRPSGSRTMAIGFRQRDARTLSVLWEDGHRDDFDVRDLRLACHCALCIEEMSGRKLLDPKTVRPDVSPQVISSIGNYAIGIDWNDGHNSGIYSFNLLRSLGERDAGKIVEDV
jgi:ATP-binding protein involved in chromosome partitioning